MTLRAPIYARVLGRASIAGLVLVVANAVHPAIWWSPTITATVVDGSTKRPIAGAQVFANWELRGNEGSSARQLAVASASTDANGVFTLRSWGPRWHFGSAYLPASAPTMRIVRTGFIPLVMKNVRAEPMNLVTSPVGHRLGRVGFEWSGATFALTAAPATPDQSYADALVALSSTLWFVRSDPRCSWEQAEPLLAELVQIERAIESAGSTRDLSALKQLTDLPRPPVACE